MPYATVLDVAIDYGPIDSDMVDKVETLLERAEARIRQVFADLDDRLASGRTNLVLVKQVEAEMVVSVLRNPDGTANASTYEVVGPFSRQSSRTFTGAASGRLELTPRQREMLGGSALNAAGSVAPVIAVPSASFYWSPKCSWPGEQL